jgi:hypothetical protein
MGTGGIHAGSYLHDHLTHAITVLLAAVIQSCNTCGHLQLGVKRVITEEIDQ